MRRHFTKFSLHGCVAPGVCVPLLYCINLKGFFSALKRERVGLFLGMSGGTDLSLGQKFIFLSKVVVFLCSSSKLNTVLHSA
jgi:hypothetical protein